MERNRSRLVILDCSAFIAGVLADESNPYIESIFKKLETGKLHAIVPGLFYLEVSNVLLQAKKKKRLNDDEFHEYLQLVTKLPFEIDETSNKPHMTMKIATLAEEFKLSAYDAVYLECAERRRVKLLTLDQRLQSAAEAISLAEICS